MSAYIVGIAGTHSTGKSTFVNALSTQLRQAGITVSTVGDVATECRDKGFGILRDHTFESTLWIMCRVAQLELEAQLSSSVVIVDRPVIDALGYLYAALEWRNQELQQQQWDYLHSFARSHITRYNQLVKTVLDDSVELGEGRDADRHFRRNVNLKLNDIFSQAGLTPIALTQENQEEVLNGIVGSIKKSLEAVSSATDIAS